MTSYQIYLKISGAALLTAIIFMAAGLFCSPWIYAAAAASLIFSFAAFGVYRKHRDDEK
ncbi:MAG TPA: hypothetical protein O0W90_01085 [Methanocorpusculum sp.]|nr:hypothetical protein [Methanocorpusculum sp.]